MNICHPTGPQPKGERVEDRTYLDYLRGERCILTGQYGNEFETVDPAHIGTYARGMKTDDEALPILHRYHAEGHQHGEVSMLRKHAPDSLIRDAFRAFARERYRDWKANQ
jgi:hypothetical protein